MGNLIFPLKRYVNGHDHCAQHIDEGTGTDYHTVGSAHGTSPGTPNRDAVPTDSLRFHAEGVDTGGFARVHITQNGLVLQVGVTLRDNIVIQVV